MTEPRAPLPESDLLAYADNRLAPEHRAEVEAALARNPEFAAEIAYWRRQDEALTTLFGSAANETVPTRLDPHAIAARSRARTRRNWPRLAAAAVVLLMLGGGAGWLAREQVMPADTPVDTLIDDAVNAHRLYVNENRHAVEVAASDHDHLVTWLSNRIARPISTPDLDAEGFTLVGGRLLPAYGDTAAGPAAQLMYQDASGDRVTVYVTAAPPQLEAGREFTSRNQFEAYYWANDRITCTVVGSLPEDRMKAVAKAIYGQLTQKT